ncbi:MAG: lytic transglycosylase domain-containing protein [Firmicutes bacterium]|nr:lytic transglycosylase domain-containing protein [Bacillota bacterium]
MTTKTTKIAAVVIAAAVVIITIFSVVAALHYRDRWDDIINYESARNNLDAGIVKRLVWVESKNDPGAVSSRGAKGLMQIMPDTGLWMAEKMEISIDTQDLFDPKINIRIGTAYLAYLKNRFDGDMRLALIAYNAGEGTLRKWLSNPELTEDGALVTIPYRETRDYVRKILKVE